jgi:hypothetical protein
MKHLLFLIVAASLYLHFYPNEKVTTFFNEQKQRLLGQFDELTDTKLQLRAENIYDDLANELDSFSDKEVERLKQISASRVNVKEFYFTICQTNKRDIVFHLNNEKKVCRTISRYSSMF